MKTLVEKVKKCTGVLADIIKLYGSIPSGHLYARIMHVCSLEELNLMLKILEDNKLIKIHGSHLIEWIGE